MCLNSAYSPGLKTLFFLQKEILFIANSKENCEKANEWLQAHAYPAVSTLFLNNMYSKLITTHRFKHDFGNLAQTT